MVPDYPRPECWTLSSTRFYLIAHRSFGGLISVPRVDCYVFVIKELYLMHVVPTIGLRVHLLTGGQLVSLTREDYLVCYHRERKQGPVSVGLDTNLGSLTAPVLRSLLYLGGATLLSTPWPPHGARKGRVAGQCTGDHPGCG